MIDASKGFELTRVYDAPADAVYRAWTEPAEAAQWWHPRGLETPVETVSIDARVGGHYRYTMIDDASGEEYPTGGEYREIEPEKRLVFTWGDPDDDPADVPVATVTIEPADDLTRLTFELRGVDGMSGDDSFYDGWDQALDALAEYLGQVGVRG